ncbi:MAG: hypothetical protein O3A20_09930 [Planctomycetota bacterium]|nr:hypothetical protein [Planctomycetota bacterium]
MKTTLSLLLLAALTAPAAAQDMIGVSWLGSAYSIDSGTGVGSLLGPVGYSGLNSMAKDPATGKLYANSGSTIIEINPTTGVGSFAVNSGLGSPRGMAFLGGTLYVVNDGSPDSLYSVNLSTGAATLIGATGYNGIQGLTSAGGMLYAWEIGYGSCVGVGLITLNTTTGIGTDVNAANGNQICDVQALCTSPGGAIYAVQDSVYKVDTGSGLLTLVGAGGYTDLRGAEFTGSGSSFVLTSTGPCPGLKTLVSANGTPNGLVAVLSGGAGSFVKPNGVCAGITIPLTGPTLRALINNNGAGAASFSFNAPAAACGASVAFVDVVSCTASNAVVL